VDIDAGAVDLGMVLGKHEAQQTRSSANVQQSVGLGVVHGH